MSTRQEHIEQREASIPYRIRNAIGAAELLRREGDDLIIDIVGGPFKSADRERVLARRFPEANLHDMLWYMGICIRQNTPPRRRRSSGWVQGWGIHTHEF